MTHALEAAAVSEACTLNAPSMSLMSFHHICTAGSLSCCSDTRNLPKAVYACCLADQVNRTGIYIQQKLTQLSLSSQAFHSMTW